jgi:trehalose 6-phosphate synthase/phosphatase
VQPSPGGLATGLASLPKNIDTLWIGWPGIAKEKLSQADQEELADRLEEMNCRPVNLSQADVKNYYQGFSNKTIWPLFHYFSQRTAYEDRYWNAYQRVNDRFCQVVSEVIRPEDQLWIHDYQLMLLPGMLRQTCTGAIIGFFLHIPFPSFELFRLLPWRKELLQGVLGADLVGFHTYDYTRHFISSACRIVGAEHAMGSLTLDDHTIKVDAFPMGINYERFAEAVDGPEVQRRLTTIRKKVGTRKIILSVDRLDYTKGIIQRVEAFDWFLSHYPHYKERVTMILVAVPSRTQVKEYAELRQNLEALIGRVNGAHGSLGWAPIWYLYRSLPFDQLVALYHSSHVALVTPLRDGMNLIAKEYLASKPHGSGVLILSEMAGAASELGEAVSVNANNKKEMVAAMKEALEMPEAEQAERLLPMQQRLRRYNVGRWANDYVQTLTEIQNQHQKHVGYKLTASVINTIQHVYRDSQTRLFLLDYDGTLMGFTGKPHMAKPDKDLLCLIDILGEQSSNRIVIISGRDKETLGQWFAESPVSLIAEHGAWFRDAGDAWLPADGMTGDWKEAIRPILELFTDRTPGSMIEEKDYSLVWHFRRSDPDLAGLRLQEVRDAILNLTANENIRLSEGSKILDIRCAGVDKGTAAARLLTQYPADFILAAGDDYTDEDLFSVLPDKAYTIKVRQGLSQAKYYATSPDNVRGLLTALVQRTGV